MKNLTIAFLAAASLFSVSACKKGGDAVAKMTEFKNSLCACKDKACADKVQADMETWAKGMGKEPDEATQKKLEPVMKEMMTCAMKLAMPDAPAAGSAAPAAGSAAPAAGSADGSAAAPAAGSADGSAAAAAPAAGGGDLPQECKDYQAAIENLAKCDKLPAQAKDALKNAYEQQAKAWASVPAEGRAALATGCKTAVDAVKQSAAMCN